jgi:hypothetical protein
MMLTVNPTLSRGRREIIETMKSRQCRYASGSRSAGIGIVRALGLAPAGRILGDGRPALSALSRRRHQSVRIPRRLSRRGRLRQGVRHLPFAAHRHRPESEMLQSPEAAANKSLSTDRGYLAGNGAERFLRQREIHTIHLEQPLHRGALPGHVTPSSAIVAGAVLIFARLESWTATPPQAQRM